MATEQAKSRAVGPEEIAEFLDLRTPDGKPDRDAVLKYAREGKIPSFRLSNKCIRFFEDEVEASARADTVWSSRCSGKEVERGTP
ncbi:MAG: helix-turn-helix domain-containing protein [Actinomycetales bacterium]|jgi:hypothetical protein|nr:helix-turn-helix domain-containing protein [Actinomycetales bacterium]